MSGLTITGFVPKTLSDIQTELEAAVQSAFGASFDVSAGSPMGQLIGIFAERAAEIWDAEEGTYASFTRDGAVGQSLDNVGALTGTPRLPPKASSVAETLVGTNGTLVPTGTVLAVAVTGTQFETLVDATIVTAASWAISTAYVAGQTVKNGSNLYRCTVGGTSAGSGGPTGTSSAITDNSVTWRFILPGSAFIDVDCASVSTGTKVAAAGTLTAIVNPVSGLTAVTNLLDAVLGRALESDAAYRLRQEAELRASGKASVGAIQDSIVQVEDVTACTVFENPTDTTDINGLPPHSIECLVTGGDDQAVANAVFDEKAAGIATHGSTTDTVTDEQGFTHSVSFSRPTTHSVWATLDLVIDPQNWPTDGVAQVKAAIVAWGLTVLTTGRDVVASLLAAQAFRIGGVLDAPPAKIGLSSSPSTTTTLIMGARDIAILDTSRIVVNTTDGTP